MTLLAAQAEHAVECVAVSKGAIHNFHQRWFLSWRTVMRSHACCCACEEPEVHAWHQKDSDASSPFPALPPASRLVFRHALVRRTLSLVCCLPVWLLAQCHAVSVQAPYKLHQRRERQRQVCSPAGTAAGAWSQCSQDRARLQAGKLHQRGLQSGHDCRDPLERGEIVGHVLHCHRQTGSV